MDDESQIGSNPYLKDLPPDRPTKIHSPLLRYIDLLVRIVAGVALIPLALLSLFLAIMAGDSPNSGILPSIVVLAACWGIVFILFLSCVMPEVISNKLVRLGKYGDLIARAPAYLYAPFGVYYGERFIAGILVNVLH